MESLRPQELHQINIESGRRALRSHCILAWSSGRSGRCGGEVGVGVVVNGGVEVLCSTAEENRD